MPYELIEEPFGEDWETVRRNFRSLRRDMNPPVPQARVFNSANISVATGGAFVPLTFNSERFDSGDLHSMSANTSRLTAPITGLYLIGGNIVWDTASAAGARVTSILINGTTRIGETRDAGSSAINVEHNVSAIWQMTAGDYAELAVIQNSGGALNVLAIAAASPEFWMCRLGGYVFQGV